MSMFENFKRGWALFKVSMSIVWQDKSMLLLPLTSGLAQLAILLTSFLGIVGVLTWVYHMSGLEMFLWLAQQMAGGIGILWIILISFAVYFPAGLVSIYFNSAVVAVALKRLDGIPATVGDGLKMANMRKGLILKWAVLSFLVNLALTLLGTIKIGKGAGAYIGKALQAGLGIVWSIAVYFVVPVIVNEGLSPMDAIKRSASLIKKSWGEALGGSMATSLVFGAFMMVGFVGLMVGLFLWATTGSYLFFVGALVIALVYWCFVGLLAECVGVVLHAALYRYATTGRTTPGFEPEFFVYPWWYNRPTKKNWI